MIFPALFYSAWNDAWTPALANHLWQSSAVTVIAWLLSLCLRKNHARMRYWLWMVASIKYLIPFSLLISAGELLRSSFTMPIQRPELAAAMQQITLPFSLPASPAVLSTYHLPAEAVSVASAPGNPWPVLLLALWLCGFLVVVFSWLRAWLRVRASIRASAPLALHAEIPVLSTPLLIEPGLFGIFRPVLLLPQGIQDRLTKAQLDAILAHEICHLRRRDNLTATLHMFVQALFWFHPAVWWIKTRLLEERELACDEIVLQSGNPADIYAESILTVCKFCIESPLPCVAGVAGSNLKRRIIRIMTGKPTANLDPGRKLLMTLAATVAIAVPVLFGLVHIRQADAQTSLQDLAGAWQGTLHAGLDLRGVIEISKVRDGQYAGIFHSIDQNAPPIPVSSISLDGATVKFVFNDFGAVFDGKLSPDGMSITGTLNQLSFVHPLTLVRATPQTAWKIPKPQPPMDAGADPAILTASIAPSQLRETAKGLTIQMGQIRMANTTLSDLITMAYAIHPLQLAGAPAWVAHDKFDITATYSGDGQPNLAQMKSLIQKLIAGSFMLRTHGEKKELPVYALRKPAGNTTILRSADDPNLASGFFFQGLGKLKASDETMRDLAVLMQSSVLDRPVIDQTGLTGRYDFSLEWTPDDSQFRAIGAKIPPSSGSHNQPPPLDQAMQQQLGLELDATIASIDTIVIDHVERPVQSDPFVARNER